MLRIKFMGSYFEIAVIWMSHNIFDDKSALLRIMVLVPSANIYQVNIASINGLVTPPNVDPNIRRYMASLDHKTLTLHVLISFMEALSHLQVITKFRSEKAPLCVIRPNRRLEGQDLHTQSAALLLKFWHQHP